MIVLALARNWRAFALVAGLALPGVCLGQLRFERTTVQLPAKGADLLVAEFPFTVGPAGSVVIGATKPDCSCTSGTLQKNAYEPGEKGIIRLEFRTANYEGPQEKRLLVEASDQPEPHVLTLFTELPKIADVQPRSVYWDNAGPRSEKLITFESGPTQPAIASFRAASDNPTVSVLVKEVIPGRKFELHLTPTNTTEVLVAKISLQVSYENKAERTFYCFGMVKPKPE